jgi:3'(2'), 5'-bisphosphate nucleotidase|tara:strand:- start:596 stop:1375 length:780 start_codon:yes stop_codon:yes gene_type:complete
MNKNELKNITEGLIETFNVAGQESIDLYAKGLKIEIKSDNSPVSNGDLRCNELITNKILELTPNIPIVSEETVDLKIKNKNKIFWLIDPIDGTKEYVAGKDEYTLNAALIINKVPSIGLVGVPKKKQLFYSYGVGDSYVIENNKIIKNDCSKKTPKNEVIALSSSSQPSEDIMKILKKYNITSVVKMASSYKFCVIANGEFDIYAAKERAHEWDYAAGHAIAEHAGAIIKTIEGASYNYGKEDYKNHSILMRRAQNLND